MKINWFKINFKTILELDLYVINILTDSLEFCNYLKQGIKCKDCDKNYLFCECLLEENTNFDYKIWTIQNISKKELINLINILYKKSESYYESRSIEFKEYNIMLKEIRELKELYENQLV